MSSKSVSEISRWLYRSIKRIIGRALFFSFFNPAQALFLCGFFAGAGRAAKRRRILEQSGKHIPPFLIASITKNCNLSCAGCYSRELSAAQNAPCRTGELDGAQWNCVFSEAAQLGISFILLAGGEPLLRRDVLEAAAAQSGILFPVFTNGTLLDESYTRFFKKNRNLFPVLSMEGGEKHTDSRRGPGVSAALEKRLEQLRKNRIPFGVSITLTTQNIDEASGFDFIGTLRKKGCAAVIFVEYVPVTEESAALAPADRERRLLEHNVIELKRRFKDMVFIAFPGDEEFFGGCLAAGRGFFHINACGGAEPCPFSPFSDVNVTEGGLSAALDSPLFTGLRSGGILQAEHSGGCTLYAQREQVSKLLAVTEEAE